MRFVRSVLFCAFAFFTSLSAAAEPSATPHQLAESASVEIPFQIKPDRKLITDRIYYSIARFLVDATQIEQQLSVKAEQLRAEKSLPPKYGEFKTPEIAKEIQLALMPEVARQVQLVLVEQKSKEIYPVIASLIESLENYRQPVLIRSVFCYPAGQRDNSPTGWQKTTVLIPSPAIPAASSGDLPYDIPVKVPVPALGKDISLGLRFTGTLRFSCDASITAPAATITTQRIPLAPVTCMLSFTLNLKSRVQYENGAFSLETPVLTMDLPRLRGQIEAGVTKPEK